MAHLGLLAVWLLLISQSDCGWIDIPKVNDILHDLPDINVHEIVNEAEDDVKAIDIQKALRTASKDTEKAMKELENDVEDINFHKMMKETSSDIKDLGNAVEPLTKDVKDALDVIWDVKKQDGKVTSCKCYGYDCGCCVHMDIPEIKLNDTVCTNVTYLPNDYGISITFSINGVVYLNETISARSPPPLCFEIPDLKHLASACLKFYDLDVSKKKFHGCVELELELVHVRMIHQDLGCFNIPLKDAGNSSRIS